MIEVIFIEWSIAFTIQKCVPLIAFCTLSRLQSFETMHYNFHLITNWPRNYLSKHDIDHNNNRLNSQIHN